MKFMIFTHCRETYHVHSMVLNSTYTISHSSNEKTILPSFSLPSLLFEQLFSQSPHIQNLSCAIISPTGHQHILHACVYPSSYHLPACTASLGSRVVPPSRATCQPSSILPHTTSGCMSCRKTAYTGIWVYGTIICIFKNKITVKDITELRLSSAFLQYCRKGRHVYVLKLCTPSYSSTVISVTRYSDDLSKGGKAVGGSEE
jgi:hypothetical protein